MLLANDFVSVVLELREARMLRLWKADDVFPQGRTRLRRLLPLDAGLDHSTLLRRSTRPVGLRLRLSFARWERWSHDIVGALLA